MDRSDEINYNITLSNGETVLLTRQEYDFVIEESLKSIDDWLSGSKYVMAEKDYERLLIGYFEWVQS